MHIEQVVEGVCPVPQLVLLPSTSDDGCIHPGIYILIFAGVKAWTPAINSFKPPSVKKPAILNTRA